MHRLCQVFLVVCLAICSSLPAKSQQSFPNTSEIYEKRAFIQQYLESAERYKQWRCLHEKSPRHKKACETAYEWMATQARAIIAELDMMEAVSFLEDSITKDRLATMTSRQEYNRTVDMTTKRARVLERVFPKIDLEQK
jgi:hypothetical protein